MNLKIFRVDTDDTETLNRVVKQIRRALGWWRFWDRFIVLPKGDIIFIEKLTHGEKLI